MNKARIVLIFIVALGASLVASAPPDAVAMGAQQRVDETRRASRRADIEIYNRAGSVRIIGWDRREVRVAGTLGQGSEGLRFDSDEDDVYIEVETHGGGYFDEPDSGPVRGSSIEIHVPNGASVEVSSSSASIEIRGVEGEVSVTTVRGSVEIAGGPRELDVETGSGNISAILTSSTHEVDLVSGSGLVSLTAEMAEVSVETVSGHIEVFGTDLRDSSFDSTAGSIHYAGNFAASNSYDFESFNGNITLVVPAAISAAIEASTHAGGIQTDFGFEPRASSRAAVGMSLEFEVGGGQADVTIETFSGSIEIRKR
jgi:DUF4097 and DUF4098 domain-containing protein YvlB